MSNFDYQMLMSEYKEIAHKKNQKYYMGISFFETTI